MSNTSGVWKPFKREYKMSPFENYQEIAQNGPLYKINNSSTMILSYEINEKLFKCKDVIPVSANQTMKKQCPSLCRIISNWVFTMSGQKHTSARKFLMEHWDLNQLKISVEEFTFELFKNNRNKKFNFIKDYAEMVSTYTFLKYFSMNLNKAKEIISYVDKLKNVIEIFVSTKQYEKMEEACLNFKKLIIKELENGKSVFFNQLYDCLDDSNDREEIFASIILLLFNTSIYTSAAQLTLSLNAILNSTTQKNFIVNNYKKRSKSIVQELIRFDSPVQIIPRIATKDIEICNKVIKKDSYILLNIGAANRDPEQFHNPNILNLNRAYKPNLSFGIGPHHCLGASLAKFSLNSFIDTSSELLPNIQLNKNSNLIWGNGIATRSLKKYPIVIN